HVPDGAAHDALYADAAVRLCGADLGRRAVDAPQWRDQRGRTVLVDARAASGTDLGGGAVPVSLAGVGTHHRLRRVGRRADAEPADRLGDRGRLGHVPVLARVAASSGCGGGGVTRRRPARVASTARISLRSIETTCYFDQA